MSYPEKQDNSNYQINLKNIDLNTIPAIKAIQEVKIQDFSDGYHSFRELYKFRKLYNALLFNEWAKMELYDVHKSKKHYDGKKCFDGEHFIVVAMLPTGQITNHYRLDSWELFKVPEVLKAKYEYDGHTPEDTVNRMKALLIQ